MELDNCIVQRIKLSQRYPQHLSQHPRFKNLGQFGSQQYSELFDTSTLKQFTYKLWIFNICLRFHDIFNSVMSDSQKVLQFRDSMAIIYEHFNLHFTSHCFMVTPCINNIQHFIFQLMHTTLKNVKLLKHFKITKLLQHVSVYKETIIRELQPVLSLVHTLGSKWIRRACTRRCQCYGCILRPVRRVYCALCEGI